MKRHQCFIADAARWNIDDPIQAGFIGGIVNEAHESDDVFDFASSIESLRADQTIRKPRLQECFFQQTGLRVGAIHHRAFARLEVTAGDQLRDAIHHK